MIYIHRTTGLAGDRKISSIPENQGFSSARRLAYFLLFSFFLSINSSQAQIKPGQGGHLRIPIPEIPTEIPIESAIKESGKAEHINSVTEKSFELAHENLMKNNNAAYDQLLDSMKGSELIKGIEVAQKVSNDLIELLSKAISVANRDRSELILSLGEKKGIEEYEKMVREGKISFNNRALGQAEMNTVDGKPFIQLTHHETGLTFLMLNSDAVQKNSRHLKQISARQHVDSFNPLTKKYGRNSFNVWIDDAGEFNKDSIEANPIKTGIKGKSVDYYYATVEIPEFKKIFWQGVALGGFQFGLAIGVGQLSEMLTDIPPSFHASILSMIYSTVISALNSTYRHWLFRGSTTRFMVKSLAQSLSFAYILRLWMGDTVNPMELEFMTHLGIWLNAIINGYSRAHYTFAAKIRQLTKMNLGKLKIGKWETPIDKGAMEYQGAYLAQFTVKILGILPGMELLGNAIFLFTTEVMKRVNVWYAEKINFKGKGEQANSAKVLRQKWEKSPLGKVERAFKNRKSKKCVNFIESILAKVT